MWQFFIKISVLYCLIKNQFCLHDILWFHPLSHVSSYFSLHTLFDKSELIKRVTQSLTEEYTQLIFAQILCMDYLECEMFWYIFASWTMWGARSAWILYFTYWLDCALVALSFQIMKLCSFLIFNWAVRSIFSQNLFLWLACCTFFYQTKCATMEIEGVAVAAIKC